MQWKVSVASLTPAVIPAAYLLWQERTLSRGPQERA